VIFDNVQDDTPVFADYTVVCMVGVIFAAVQECFTDLHEIFMQSDTLGRNHFMDVNKFFQLSIGTETGRSQPFIGDANVKSLNVSFKQKN
jgi:hypothetical protein